MKKFSFCLCTSAVKGMHTAVCIVLFSVSVLAQNTTLISKPDSMPFKKWEVSLDVKPLFRSDASYNIMAKWHFSERSALRMGLGTTAILSQKDTSRIREYYLDGITQQMVTQYEQYRYGPDETKYINWEVKIGYQYEFKHGRISLYTASDLDWKIERTMFDVPVEAVSGPTGTVEPFKGYQSVWGFIDRKIYYSIIQSIGFKYTINDYLSFTLETSFLAQYIEFNSGTSESPYVSTPDKVYIKNTTLGGTANNFSFNPLMGLFINYHF